MTGQMSLYDMPQSKPDYHGSNDEIVRLDAEHRFERMIILQNCCGDYPGEYFKSCHEYYVRCKHCGKHTKTFGHMYQAMQAWNRGEHEEGKSESCRRKEMR